MRSCSIFRPIRLCWVPDAGVILKRLARIVKPGGVLVFQEYLDWGAMKLVPPSDSFANAVEACMRSWVVGNATINIAEQLPTLGERCGLVLERFEPIARLGAVGSLEWRWVMGFLLSYLPGLVERRLLTDEEYGAFGEDYRRRSEEGRTHIYTPTMANVIFRRKV
jgi:SAM-dependent methyltransferase